MTQFLITTKGLAKAYQDSIALQPLDLQLQSNRIYGLIGRNGSGKSTLIKLLAELEQPCFGSINTPNNLTCGYVSNELGYPNFIKLNALSELFKKSHQLWDEERYLDVLQIFGLNDLSAYGNLSTGQKAGVKLAVLLAQHHKIWLLDEATLGIDIVAQGHSLTALLKYFIEDEPCVLFCTHDMNEIERLADEVLVMEAGRIHWQGEKDELIQDPNTLSESVYSLFNNQELLQGAGA